MKSFLVHILSLAITPSLYLIVPLFLVATGKQISRQSIKRITLINSLLVWLICVVFVSATGGNPSKEIGPFVIWGWVGYWILKKYCLKIEKPSSSNNSIRILVSDENETHNVYGSYHVYSKYTPPNTKPTESAQDSSQTTPSFESTSTPTKANPSEVSPESKRHSLLTPVLIIFLVISLILNISLYSKSLKSSDNSLQLPYNDQYFEFWYNNHKKLDFIDRSVVFVEDNGTNLYHKYECASFTGNSYWAFNTEYAEYLGYSSCPQCIH